MIPIRSREKFAVIIFALQVALTNNTYSQDPSQQVVTHRGDKPDRIYHFNGNISITNNGFSSIPTFSLGKPATIADLSIGGKKISFDPQFRFDLNGLKPWSFILITLTGQ
jgi:hypothetical protein